MTNPQHSIDLARTATDFDVYIGLPPTSEVWDSIARLADRLRSLTRAPRRPRRMQLDRAIAQAEKAGKTVTAATATRDAVALTFGQATDQQTSESLGTRF